MLIKLLRLFTKSLPNIKYSGVITNIVRNLNIKYKWVTKRQTVKNIKGFVTMTLNPLEEIQGTIFWSPNIYDYKEFNFLTKNILEGTFLDIGANVGIYSLVMAKHLGSNGVVISIEAAPTPFKILQENIKLNELQNIIPLNIAISDKEKIIDFYPGNDSQLGGGSINKIKGIEPIKINSKAIDQIIEDLKLTNITCIKLDIEGHEYTALKDSKVLNQSHLIVLCEITKPTYENIIKLMTKKGFTYFKISPYNYIFSK